MDGHTAAAATPSPDDEIAVELPLKPDLEAEQAELLTLLAVALLQQGGSVAYHDDDVEEVVASVDGVAVVSDLRTTATALKVTYAPPDVEPARLRSGRDAAVITPEEAVVEYHIGPTGEGLQARLLTILAMVLRKAGDVLTFDARDAARVWATVGGIVNRFNRRTRTSTLQLARRR
jgi:hypothetical protein